MKYIKSLLIAITVFNSGFTLAEDQSLDTKEKAKQYIKKQQLLQKQINWELAPVKTQDDLYLNLEDSKSPLHLLSESAKRRFVDSVVFREDGIGGFYYKDLEIELTPTQIYKILSLIGQQHATPYFEKARIETTGDQLLLATNSSNINGGGNIVKDIVEGYRCVSPATCRVNTQYACTSNC